MLEVDANPNPLRDLTSGPLSRPAGGVMTLSNEPGLGIEPDIGALAKFARGH
jgi:L-alanine-DL-glutamate epimerase-like enolase superfamily enzyme